MKESITIGEATVSLSHFAGKSEVEEYHLMIKANNSTATFQQQLDSVLDAYESVIGGKAKGATAVFKRYYLSDAANQADDVILADTSDCAKSIIEQAPLDGTKIALWAYLLTNVETRLTASGLYEAKHGQYRHLWGGSASNKAANSEYQMRLLFNEYNMQLLQEGCTVADNCVRTWLFVNDIDNNYGGVVRARNQYFFTQGLTSDTHFIASTGIGGRQQAAEVLVQMDTYAIGGISTKQVNYLYAPTHLNRTSEYGVSFERGTTIDYGDRRHVLISGTASINNKGEIMHRKDVVSQTRRMWENVEALLNEAKCSMDDISEITVYLRDPADYLTVSRMFAERFPDTPYIIVKASVCRPGWLVEMECMAVKQCDTDFAAF